MSGGLSWCREECVYLKLRIKPLSPLPRFQTPALHCVPITKLNKTITHLDRHMKKGPFSRSRQRQGWKDSADMDMYLHNITKKTLHTRHICPLEGHNYTLPCPISKCHQKEDWQGNEVIMTAGPSLESYSDRWPEMYWIYFRQNSNSYTHCMWSQPTSSFKQQSANVHFFCKNQRNVG